MEIEMRCAECDSELGPELSLRGAYNHELRIEISPCLKCLRAAMAEEYDKGFAACKQEFSDA